MRLTFKVKIDLEGRGKEAQIKLQNALREATAWAMSVLEDNLPVAASGPLGSLKSPDSGRARLYYRPDGLPPCEDHAPCFADECPRCKGGPHE